MDTYQKQFLDETIIQAKRSNHVFPEMAACEAALESGYGTSGLAIKDHNLFGMKQHSHPVYGTHNLPTREWVGLAKDVNDGVRDGWITVIAHWVSYPDEAACFSDRMATLQRLSNVYPHYKAAIEAQDPITYVTEVSKTWSTDPNRAQKVINIYTKYKQLS